MVGQILAGMRVAYRDQIDVHAVCLHSGTQRGRRSGTVFILITKALFLSFAGKTSGGDGFVAAIVSFCGEECNAGQNSPKHCLHLKKLQFFLEKGRFPIDSLVIIEV